MNQQLTKSDLVTAISNPSLHKAPCLIGGKPRYSNGSNGSYSAPLAYSGSFATVFRFDKSNGECVAVRCWNVSIQDECYKMQEISTFIKSVVNQQYFAGFNYLPDAIDIPSSSGMISAPILEMEWLDGQDLFAYMEQHIHNRATIEKLASDFYKMIGFLHSQNIAHGDLQNNNIKIDAAGNVKLIDYDSLYLPSFHDVKDTIKGYPQFQHPLRKENIYAHEKLDYFSEYVIYLSILVAADQPAIWLKYAGPDNQLFQADDFTNPDKSRVFSEVKAIVNPQIKELALYLLETLKFTDINQITPLENKAKVSGGIDVAAIVAKFASIKSTPTPKTTTNVDIAAIIAKFRRD